MKASLLQPCTPALTCQLPLSPRLAQESGWGHPRLKRYRGYAAIPWPPPHRPPSVRHGEGCVPGEGRDVTPSTGQGKYHRPHTGLSTADVLAYSVPFLSGQSSVLSSVVPGQLEGQVEISHGGFCWAGVQEGLCACLDSGSSQCYREKAWERGPVVSFMVPESKAMSQTPPGSLNTQPQWVPSLSLNLRSCEAWHLRTRGCYRDQVQLPPIQCWDVFESKVLGPRG